MGHKIFVSYRRDDCASEALSIAQFLERTFGRNSVFMDVDIHAGANFPLVLDQRLAQCSILLALIGPNWLEARNQDGQLRLNDPDDWVRMEIGRALMRRITIIPVCVNHTTLPGKSALPAELHALVNHQAAFVTTSRFRNDMAGLVRDIRAIQSPRRRWHIGLLAAGVPALLIALSILFYFRMPSRKPQPQPQSSAALLPGSPSQAQTAPPKASTSLRSNLDKQPPARKQPADIGEVPQPGQPENTPMKGTVHFHSDPGDFIGGGKDWTVGDADGIFKGKVNGNTIDISYHGDDWWSFTFAAPEGSRLIQGTYLKATRAPFNSPVKPGLSVTGAGRGCNTLTGQFDIHRIVYSDSGSQLKRLLADFVQHCEAGTPALSGTIDLTAANAASK